MAAIGFTWISCQLQKHSEMPAVAASSALCHKIIACAPAVTTRVQYAYLELCGVLDCRLLSACCL